MHLLGGRTVGLDLARSAESAPLRDRVRSTAALR